MGPQLRNVWLRNATKTVDIGDTNAVEVLPFNGNTKYLGRKLTCDDYHKTELNNRISAGWRKFNLLRHELTSTTYPLWTRLKLFNTTVLPTVMYGCQSWTMTQDMMTTLKRPQRRMMRLIIKAPRRRQTPATPTGNIDRHNEDQSTDDVNSTLSTDVDLENLIQLSEQELLEPWPEFIKRTTHGAEQLAKKHNVDDWTTHYFRQKWRWAARVAKQAHDRWSWLVAGWEPQAHDRRPCNRLSSRPRTRWDDDINHYLQTTTQHTDNSNAEDATPNWLQLATNDTLWKDLEEKFIACMTQAPPTTTTPQ